VESVCRGGEIGCVQCKKQLGERLVAYLQPIYERRLELENRRDDIRQILEAGAVRAREAAAETMDVVRDAMNLTL
jgi:tryptophanyl-tRNA synthetase